MAKTYPSINFSPPKAVQAAYARGLKLKDAYGGKGLREPTLQKAEHFAHGGDNDPAHARKMRGWFARHAVDQKPGWDKPPTPGFVARLLWGGDAGERWANKLTQQMERADADAKDAKAPQARSAAGAKATKSVSKKSGKKASKKAGKKAGR